jgi:hypothetical protein
MEIAAKRRKSPLFLRFFAAILFPSFCSVSYGLVSMCLGRWHERRICGSSAAAWRINLPTEAVGGAACVPGQEIRRLRRGFGRGSARLTRKANVLSYEVRRRAIPYPLFCPGRKVLLEKRKETERWWASRPMGRRCVTGTRDNQKSGLITAKKGWANQPEGTIGKGKRRNTSMPVACQPHRAIPTNTEQYRLIQSNTE